jgi:hypothetical protein
MFYYTAEFAAVTPDIITYIDHMLNVANQGYANSGLPIKVTRHCVSLADIKDTSTKWGIIKGFVFMKGVAENYLPTKDWIGAGIALRQSADAAVLLTAKLWMYGTANGPPRDPINDGLTVSTCHVDACATFFTFAHELGHNMGATHKQGQVMGQTGHHTIMSYGMAGSKRVNYWSDPDKTYLETGKPLGATGTADNHAPLMKYRIAMAAVGDESAVCTTDSALTITNKYDPPPTSNLGKAIYLNIMSQTNKSESPTIDVLASLMA